MKNKNLFILLFSFVVVTSFVASETVNKAVQDSAVKANGPKKGSLKEVEKNLELKKDKEAFKKKSAKEVAKEPERKSEKAQKGKKIGKEIAVEKKDKEKLEAKKELKKEKAHDKPEAAKKKEIEPEKEALKGIEKDKENVDLESKPEIFLIDKIETVIYGPEETSIITKTDLERMGLDGQQRTKEKMIFESLIFQDAKKYNILDENLVDKYIESIQAQQNLSLDEIKKMFNDFGYTYEEGREQLAVYNTINQLMDYKVRSKVIIPEKEVREYYDANPFYIEEAYNLQRIFIPVQEDIDLEQEKKNIESKLAAGEFIEAADYSENFWVEKPELAQDKLFISSMAVGEISDPVLIAGGFEVFKLIDRRDMQLASFDQRYREIVEKLREPLYDKLFDEYKDSLFKDSVIIDL